MPFANRKIMLLTHALRRADKVLEAIEALHGTTDRGGVEGLVELLDKPPSARAATSAIHALKQADGPVVIEALVHCLGSEHALVRLTALRALHERKAGGVDEDVLRVLHEDGVWMVRRQALRFLADRPEPACVHILDSANDPHWRVRHALIKVLLTWDREKADDAFRRNCMQFLPCPRIEGVRLYLQFRRGETTASQPPLHPVRPVEACSFWDADTMVLARNLERMTPADVQDNLAGVPHLLGYPDERVQRLAVDMLNKHGQAEHLARAVAQLEEPRTGARESVARLLGSLDLDRIEETARCILHDSNPSPVQLAWAIDQVDDIFPAEEEADRLDELLASADTAPKCVQAAIERWKQSARDRPSSKGYHARIALAESMDEVERKSMHDDPHPLVRAAALTEELAQMLMADPQRETSWAVLTRAARLTKTPLWKIEPEEPWRPERQVIEAAPLHPRHVEPVHPRVLGNDLIVAPMGISGHYGLPVEGFVRAMEEGINLMFWEPNYQTMIDFARRLGPADRNRIHFICGTFEADGQRVRKDAERALRVLGIERIALFLLFWVHEWNRITPDVRQTLDSLRDEGKVAGYSLSTHNRRLAVEALEAGWNPVMVRHSAAHRGAEEAIFPRALQLGASLITFNNTCYGRLLQPGPDGWAPTAADCYRYTLSHPAVTACLSAPATLDQLDENLQAIREPALPEERKQRLLTHGKRVYEEDTIFRKLVRSV